MQQPCEKSPILAHFLLNKYVPKKWNFEFPTIVLFYIRYRFSKFSLIEGTIIRRAKLSKVDFNIRRRRCSEFSHPIVCFSFHNIEI